MPIESKSPQFFPATARRSVITVAATLRQAFARTVKGATVAVACFYCQASVADNTRDVLSAVRAAMRPWGRCTMQAEEAYTEIKSNDTERVYREQTLLVGRRDGELFDVTVNFRQSTQPISEKPEDLASRSGAVSTWDMSTRDIWDGKQYYRYEEITGEKLYDLRIYSPGGNVIPGRLPVSRVLTWPNSALVGVFPGDLIPFYDILQPLASSDVSWVDASVEGVHCKLIDGKSSLGSYLVWVAPDRGYCVLKAIVRKTAGEHYYDERLGDPLPVAQVRAFSGTGYPVSPLTAVDFELNGVTVEKWGGSWVDSTADWKVTKEYGDGSDTIGRTHYRLVNCDFAPEFTKIHAFVPWFHDGAEVEVEGKANSAIPLRWHNGRVEPAVDEAEQEKLEKEIQDALKEKGQQ